MNFMSKLERKFGRYAIRNLTTYIIAGYVIGYVLCYVNFYIFFELLLIPEYVMEGQIWRLVTWVITPPSLSNIFLTIIMFYFYYVIGHTLERAMGAFRYNIYMLGGMFVTMVGVMVAYIIATNVLGMDVQFAYVDTYYICISIFLAISVIYPDAQVYYMMILPIKMKWLSIVYLIFAVYRFYNQTFIGRVTMIMSLLNFFLFYISTKNMSRYTPKNAKRRKDFKKKMKTAKATQSSLGHKCVFCGVTSTDAPHLQFRYCSKCRGNMEYCQDHLFTHEHKM